MGSSNMTKFYLDGGITGDSEVFETTCMSFTRSSPMDINIILPYKDLQSGLSREDVLKWVEIGNKLLFPCNKIEDIHFQKTGFLSQKLRDSNILVEYINQNDPRNSPWMFKTGTIDSIAIFGNQKTHAALLVNVKEVTTTGANYGYRSGTKCTANSNDLRVKSTGEPLNDLIKRISSESFEELKTKDKNAFKITIPLSTIKKEGRKLSAMTFYRYLWSNLYSNIVRDTLTLMEKGENEWNALMLSHLISAQSGIWEPYYSLVKKYASCVVDIDSAMKSLDLGASINNSFSTQTIVDPNIPRRIKEGDAIARDNFKSKSTPKNMTATCVGDYGTRTITKHKVYKVLKYDGYKIKITADDFCARTYNGYRFKINN